jgi:hypothetical protein
MGCGCRPGAEVMTDYQTPLNERTLISTQEYQQLRAEVERLRTNQNTVLAAELRAIKEAELRAEVEQLRAENARLRGENVRQKSLIAQYELLLMPETKP